VTSLHRLRLLIDLFLLAKRERFVASVTCPQCALNGSATLEENGSGKTTIISQSRGFRIGPGYEIICSECGVKARIIGIASGTKRGVSRRPCKPRRS
jgi:hypothetical protein